MYDTEIPAIIGLAKNYPHMRQKMVIKDLSGKDDHWEADEVLKSTDSARFAFKRSYKCTKLQFAMLDYITRLAKAAEVDISKWNVACKVANDLKLKGKNLLVNANLVER